MGKKGSVRIKQVGSKVPKMFNPMDELAAGIPADEMINLPPPPDRKFQMYWPIHETFSMNASKFQIIYPSYLDSTKSIKQGRRIGKEEAVTVPTVSDISLALQTLKIRHVLQPYKGYSRDIETLWENPGRVKVDLSNNQSKRELLLQLAKIIPSLPERQKRLEEEAKQNLILHEKEEMERKESQKAAQQQHTQQQQVSKSTNKSANNKKTGKKKR